MLMNTTKYDFPSDIVACTSTLKKHMAINAGAVVESAIKQGRDPKNDADCQKAFLMLSHIEEIEKYINQ